MKSSTLLGLLRATRIQRWHTWRKMRSETTLDRSPHPHTTPGCRPCSSPEPSVPAGRASRSRNRSRESFSCCWRSTSCLRSRGSRGRWGCLFLIHFSLNQEMLTDIFFLCPRNCWNEKQIGEWFEQAGTNIWEGAKIRYPLLLVALLFDLTGLSRKVVLGKFSLWLKWLTKMA